MTDNDQIPGFELRRVISQSAIATVYEAYQPTLNRKAFLKKLHPQFAKDSELRDRFKREAQICAKVKHPNLVDIYDYITTEEMVVLVLEFIEGHSLAELLKAKGPFPVNVAISVFSGILKGLGYAHAKGVIHRDLKPENILISDEGIVKISDWGLSFSPELSALTLQGMAVGTPAYMSPEAASGGQITSRSDLFSLGVTAFEIFTGKRIFQGANISETLKMVLSDTPPRLQEFRDDIPSGIDRLIAKLLEKSPNRRFTSTEEVDKKLQDVLVENPMNIGHQVILDFMQVPSTQIEITPTHSEKIRIRRRRSLVGAWIFVVILLIVGWIILRPTEIEKPSNPSLTTDAADSMVSPSQTDSIPELAMVEPKTDTSSPPVQTRSVITPIEKSSQKPEKPTIQKPDTTVFRAANSDTSSIAYATPIPRGKGYLSVTCDPWANIFIDNRFIGQTPISQDIELDAGKVQLALVNPEFPPVAQEINIDPGQRHRVSISLWDNVGVIKLHVKPWADIYLDGKYLDRTPLSKPIIVSLGTHQLRLVNEYFQTWEDTIIFKKGDPPIDLKITLESLN